MRCSTPAGVAHLGVQTTQPGSTGAAWRDGLTRVPFRELRGAAHRPHQRWPAQPCALAGQLRIKPTAVSSASCQRRFLGSELCANNVWRDRCRVATQGLATSCRRERTDVQRALFGDK